MTTMKHIIWMVAIALTATTWSACSNDDEPTTAEQPAQSRTYTVTTTLSPRDGGTTRSTMTDNGDGSISATWVMGDQIRVEYKNTSDGMVETTAEVTAVNPSTKAATVTMMLTDPKDGGNISFFYPRSFWEVTKDERTDQIGTLDDINENYAAIWCEGTMTVSNTDVTLSGLLTMVPETCIWKFSFKDGSTDITSAITKLIIDFPDPQPQNHQTYTVTPTSQSTIYVSIIGNVITNRPVCITAVTATGVYRKAAASVTMASGTTYTTTDLAMKKAEVGKVLGADGNIYDNATAATNAGTTARAMITCVGSATGEAAPYNHGLALAMSDAANGAYENNWSTSTSSTVHAYTASSSNVFSTESESGLQYNNYDPDHNTDTYPAFKAAMANNGTAAPTGCSAWFLPTAYQWNQMISACSGVLGSKTGDKTDLQNGFSNAGGTNLEGGYYWLSTEQSAQDAWRYYFGPNQDFKYDLKTSWGHVRSCLAF